MSIKVGRAHGNGYHDSVVRKITAKRSKGYYDLKEYEMEQLEQHGNIIYERDYNSDSIARVCLGCPTSYHNGHIEAGTNFLANLINTTRNKTILL